ncbi:MAG TPA: PDZ domain-containing protein [Acidimicrobiia bacterium]|nr:PDZ domain-containing protein [Acidimicrobiia bacterium]
MEDESARGSSWPLYLVGALFAVGALALGAWNIELPYLAFSSGPVSDAADAISAEEVDTYPPDGELLMLTVVSQDVNVFEALIAGFDPTIDLVRKEAYRPPDESDEDYRQRVLAQMDDSEQRAITVALGYLGYDMTTTDVLVTDLVEEAPSSQVLEIGDSIDSFDGVEIVRGSDLTDALEGHQPGDLVELGITREGAQQLVEVELAEREDDSGGAMIGITVSELAEPPFPLSIEAGSVGGPSAGMMHTLAIVDTLTPGELTQGHVIAGTGTIAYDGTVGRIGGIRQKIVGAEAAGAEFVLVPAGNYEEALTAERKAIEIVPVGTIQEALDFLENLGAV